MYKRLVNQIIKSKRIMRQSITIQFQSASENQRPTDESLNRETIWTDNMGDIPSVGDFVCFDNEDEIEVVYKVRSRLFDYKYIDCKNNDEKDYWSITANIVVERQPDGTYKNLIKH